MVIKFINETNVIIKQTAPLVKKNKNYTGGVVKGIEFQKKAIKNMNNGKIQKALNDSYMARRLVFVAHNANTKKPITQAWHTTSAEKKWITIKVTNLSIEAILTPEIVEKEKDDNNITTDDLSDVK